MKFALPPACQSVSFESLLFTITLLNVKIKDVSSDTFH
jgi:hypothetical protein